MHNMRQEVSNNIEHMRKTRDLTQEVLAEKVEVTRQTIIALEKGNYIPSLLLALKISRFFNTSVEKLFSLKQ